MGLRVILFSLSLQEKEGPIIRESGRRGSTHCVWRNNGKKRITADFSLETMKARRKWNNMIKVLKEKIVNL